MVGGITRLTRSGLSIVEWKPFTGIIPPLSEESWQEEFEKYKKYPEFQKINHQMTLSEFKFIFFWEFMHRLLGRVIGFVFLIPFIYFYRKKYLTGELLYKTGIAFILGGLQGFMGWYMVQSGLDKIPRVSHYRLAAHLLLALFIMMYILWILLEIYFSKAGSAGTSDKITAEAQDQRSQENAAQKISFAKLQKSSWALTILIVFQIIYGAFTAGIRAGYLYNTFPLMGLKWIPDEIFQMSPAWINFFENMVTVQFIHRSAGWMVLFATGLFYFYSRKFSLRNFQKKGILILLFSVFIQFILGIFTILYSVPVSTGVIHQMGAVFLLSAAVFVNFSLTSRTVQESA